MTPRIPSREAAPGIAGGYRWGSAGNCAQETPDFFGLFRHCWLISDEILKERELIIF